MCRVFVPFSWITFAELLISIPLLDALFFPPSFLSSLTLTFTPSLSLSLLTPSFLYILNPLSLSPPSVYLSLPFHVHFLLDLFRNPFP